ncbi:AAA domain-containing protein [Bacillus sp. OK048]|uniref:AAA domain-containing protein n=1 Tax=Bacillus sp. OK048 TaxID=1882761 RepID=UPI00088173A9|nr:AAA domain-containing protein [Bacillus sp. OK048]SDN63571.1 Superfamily I DNA and/or RNA helicase [Bacillus sp. OK048]
MAVDTSKVSRIFEYLLAVKNLNEKIYRNVNEYEKVFWQKDIPHVDGFFVGGKGTNDDAWFEVHKQEIPSAPPVPPKLKNWIVKYDDPDITPITHPLLVTRIDVDGNEIVEYFEDDYKRVNLYRSWLNHEWTVWAGIASQKRKIQQLYTELFTLFQRFQREGEELELACGHGLLQWDIDGKQISQHVLVTKLEIIFDAKKGIFHLVPTSKGTAMETDMLLHIDFPNATRFMQMESQILNLDFSPNETNQIRTFMMEIVQTISPSGSLITDKKDSSKNVKTPIISFSPALFLRNTGGRLWQQELTNAIEKIKEGFPVPETIKKLITTKNTTDIDSQAISKEWEAIGENLLFPLETNKEQQLIAQKLATNSAVVIQGPPGTGKSHTIANLISHLLAHGKRVLVTSEKERALKVLKNKIPEEIRPLCVSVLGGDSKSVKEIEESIRVIAENIDTKQPELLQENIDRLTTDLKTTKNSIARIDKLINEAAARENTARKFGDLQLTPLEAAKWLNEHKAYSWLPDKIKPDKEFPLSDEELTRFFELLGILTKADLEALSLKRPNLTLLPQPQVLSEKIDEIQKLEGYVNQTEKHIVGWKLDDYLNLNYEKWIKKTINTIENLKQLQNPKWLFTIIKDCVRDNGQTTYWNQFIDEVENKLTDIQALENELIEHKIVLTNKRILPDIKEDLLLLKEKLTTNPKIGWMYKNISGRKIRYLFDEIKVDNFPLRKLEDVDLVIKQIELITRKQMLSIKWNKVLDEIGGTIMEESQKRFVLIIKDKCSSIRKAANFVKNTEQDFQDLLPLIGKQENPAFYDEQWLNDLHNGLLAFNYKKLLNEAEEYFDLLRTYVNDGIDQSSSYPIWNQLSAALQKRDKSLWETSIGELARIESLVEDYEQFLKLKESLNKVTPNWTIALLEKGGQGMPLMPPIDLAHAWFWRQVDSWIGEIHAKTKIEMLESQRKMAKHKEQKIIKELIAESTWKEQISRTSRKQKMSLIAWLKVFQRAKGQSRYSIKYRKDASREMKVAKDAIPVWIMPIHRVIENFDLTEDLFDVIIIDESSQSNLFSLTALLRAKKAIVVGDENQISPENAFTDISDIHELIERFLYDVPNPMQFDIRTSLYDTANRVFESKIVLKEHFRCVPEIIKFSDNLMYNGKIDPLRLPLIKDLITPPVISIRVKGGSRLMNTSKVINMPEAMAIADYTSNCINDPRYKDKTIGVITLLGNDQPRILETLIREKIGEEEMVKRNIVVGDAYAFQGDERDIILLSLVIAPNVRYASLSKKDAMQRFNVAASRARDQMILFHSVDLNDLNPNDVRHKLLLHCSNYKEKKVQPAINESEFNSGFEKDIFTHITKKGYHVVPQVKVGSIGKPIDMVIEGERTRLAIECDGDVEWQGVDKWEAEIDRQRVLERVGWTFLRIRGSVFYSNPEIAMKPLWAKLNEIGIFPFTHQEETMTQDFSEKIIIEKSTLKKSHKGEVKVKVPSKGERAIKIPANYEKNSSEQTMLFSPELEGYNKQVDLMDLLEEEPESLYDYFISKKYEVIDKRPNRGNLWVVGGIEIESEMNKLKEKGITFKFTNKGSRATGNKPAWYTKNQG